MRTIILKLGGSIFMPKKINTNYLKNFKELIEEYIKKNYRFIIIVGGGYICRNYQNALSKVINADNNVLDWMGIHVTQTNAHLLKLMFENNSSKDIITDPTKPVNKINKIIIAAGYKPGWSTDYDAMLLAKQFDDKKIVVLSNIKHIYNDDPRTNLSAKPIKKMSWEELQNIVGKKWIPGRNVPMDPEAVKEGKKQNVKVVFADGKNLNNFRNILDDKDFEGTIIQ